LETFKSQNYILKNKAGQMVAKQCSICRFQFEEGIYLMKNKTDHICIFCLKKKFGLNISDLIDNRQLRIINNALDRKGCIQLFIDLL
jgi:hypothetical protein